MASALATGQPQARFATHAQYIKLQPAVRSDLWGKALCGTVRFMVIMLIGMKHCGKSTLGAALASRWGWAFYDVDRLLEQRHACQAGEQLTVREIFAQRGEARFVELETQVVRELCMRFQQLPQNAVVAVGGRTALNPRLQELLTALGTIVYLELSPEEMYARVQRTGIPAFVDQADPAKHFRQLYEQRAPCYQRLAHLTVNLDGLDPHAALEKLSAALAALRAPER